MIRRGFTAALALMSICALGMAAIAAPSAPVLPVPHTFDFNLAISPAKMLFATPKVDQVLKPAQAINPTTNYPFGADNGEQIWQDSGPATIKYAPLIATTAGSPNAIVAAVSGSKVRILGLYLTNSVAGTLQFVDTAGTPNNLTGVITLAANGNMFIPATKFGMFEAGTGLGVSLNVTGTSNVVGGYVVYVTH
jgi:hypothetical protein